MSCSGYNSVTIVPNFVNIGGGEEVFVDGSNPAEFRTISGAGDIDVSLNGPMDEIVITLDIENAPGGGAEVLIDPQAPGLAELRTLTASNNILATQGPFNIDFDLDIATTGAGGESLIDTDVAGSVILNEITGSGDILASSGAGVVDLALDIVSSGGAGESIIESKVPGTVTLRTINSGGNILSVQAGGAITHTLDVNQIGPGIPVIAVDVPGLVEIKSVSGSGNIVINDNGVNLEFELDIAPVGGGASVIANDNPGLVELKAFNGLNNISLIDTGTDLNFDLNIDNTGTGTSMIAIDIPGLVAIKGLTAGTGISIVDNGPDLEISTSTTFANVGVGADVYVIGTDADFRRINGLNNISVAQVGPTIEVDLNILSSGGAGASLIEADLVGSVTLRTLNATGNIALATAAGANTLSLSAFNVGGATGEIVAGTSGAGNIDIKTLSGSGGVIITNNASTIDINAPAAAVFNSLGVGAPVYVSPTTADFRSILGLNNISVAVSGGGDEVEIDLAITSAAVAGTELIESSASGSLVLRRITGTGNIAINTPIPGVVEVALDVSSTGGPGESLVAVDVPGTGTIKTITGGTGITLTNNITSVDIALTTPAPVFNSIGVGVPIYVAPTSADFRSIRGINNIAITLNVDTIEVDLNVTSTGAGGESLIETSNTGVLVLREITGANNVNVTQVGGLITVDLNVSATGAGTSMVDTDALGVVTIKGLTAGLGIDLTDNGTSVEIASTTSFANVGAGADVYVLGSDADFRRINGLNNISVAQVGNTIEINLDVSHTGVGTSLINTDVAGTVTVKGLTAGTGISIVNNPLFLEIASSTSFANVGAGSAVYVTGSNANFRRITGLNNITVGTNVNTVEINLDINSVVVGGTELIETDIAGTVSLRRITSTGNILTSQVGGLITMALDVSATGSGTSMVATDVPGTVTIKGLSVGSGISIVDNGPDLTIASTTTFANVGAGSQVYVAASNANFRTITGLNNVSVATNVNVIEIDLAANNVGAGTGTLVAGSSGSGNVDIKSLIAGSGIDITNNASDVEIARLDPFVDATYPHFCATCTPPLVVNIVAAGLLTGTLPFNDVASIPGLHNSGDFNTATNTFTVPRTGFYSVGLSLGSDYNNTSVPTLTTRRFDIVRVLPGAAILERIDNIWHSNDTEQDSASNTFLLTAAETYRVDYSVLVDAADVGVGTFMTLGLNARFSTHLIH